VKGDKVARALAVQPIFTQWGVYAPAKDYAELVINEAAQFPAGRFSDLTDSMTQALKFIRDMGLAESDAEVEAERREAARHRARPKRLYF
jgi:phage terminase large subunit-like protein